ncbi:hypothetical protein BGZ94_000557 [Podila epigama]|nr:hypothetical protein BGZ94_000557 [Podila epigama]
MFNVFSWIRSSDSQSLTSSKDNNAASVQSSAVDTHQDDWVFLPSDHSDLMERSCANLDLLSTSTMTLHSSSASDQGTCHDNESVTVHKSRRQLKNERRRQLAQEELERKPRYDPFIAKLRDQEFQRAKLAKLALRSGRIMSSSTGGAHSIKSLRGGSSGSLGASGPRICDQFDILSQSTDMVKWSLHMVYQGRRSSE